MNDDRYDSFLHRAKVIELLNRYFAALDEKTFDTATMRAIFADNGCVVRPNGAETQGPQTIGESHRHSMSRFRATQHMASGFIVTLKDGGKAAFRANLVALHFWAEGLGDPSVDPADNYFLAGGVISGEAVMTEQGWRVLRVGNDVVWRRGTGFGQILQTQSR